MQQRIGCDASESKEQGWRRVPVTTSGAAVLPYQDSGRRRLSLTCDSVRCRQLVRARRGQRCGRSVQWRRRRRRRRRSQPAELVAASIGGRRRRRARTTSQPAAAHTTRGRRLGVASALASTGSRSGTATHRRRGGRRQRPGRRPASEHRCPVPTCATGLTLTPSASLPLNGKFLRVGLPVGCVARDHT